MIKKPFGVGKPKNPTSGSSQLFPMIFVLQVHAPVLASHCWVTEPSALQVHSNISRKKSINILFKV